MNRAETYRSFKKLPKYYFDSLENKIPERLTACIRGIFVHWLFAHEWAVRDCFVPRRKRHRGSLRGRSDRNSQWPCY